MIRSTFISFGLHSFLLTLAYLGLPALKTKESIELPIDIVEDTPISSKTSLFTIIGKNGIGFFQIIKMFNKRLTINSSVENTNKICKVII